MKKKYVICYDIVDNRKRYKTSEALKDYGIRVQKSVFECDVTPESLVELKARIKEIINTKEDSVIFYLQCASCEKEMASIGQKIYHLNEDFRVL